MEPVVCAWLAVNIRLPNGYRQLWRSLDKARDDEVRRLPLLQSIPETGAVAGADAVRPTNSTITAATMHSMPDAMKALS
jgi:hypothetical protein